MRHCVDNETENVFVRVNIYSGRTAFVIVWILLRKFSHNGRQLSWNDNHENYTLERRAGEIYLRAFRLIYVSLLSLV